MSAEDTLVGPRQWQSEVLTGPHVWSPDLYQNHVVGVLCVNIVHQVFTVGHFKPLGPKHSIPTFSHTYNMLGSTVTTENYNANQTQ